MRLNQTLTVAAASLLSLASACVNDLGEPITAFSASDAVPTAAAHLKLNGRAHLRTTLAPRLPAQQAPAEDVLPEGTPAAETPPAETAPGETPPAEEAPTPVEEVPAGPDPVVLDYLASLDAVAAAGLVVADLASVRAAPADIAAAAAAAAEAAAAVQARTDGVMQALCGGDFNDPNSIIVSEANTAAADIAEGAATVADAAEPVAPVVSCDCGGSCWEVGGGTDWSTVDTAVADLRNETAAGTEVTTQLRDTTTVEK